MYRVLKNSLKRKKVTNKEISELLNIHENTTGRKMNFGYFTTVEAEKIYREFFVGTNDDVSEGNYRKLFEFDRKERK